MNVRQPLNRSFLGVSFCAAFVLLAACYWATLQVPYAHHDQTKYFQKAFNTNTFERKEDIPQYKWFYTVGRPVVAELEAIVSRHARTLEGLFLFRWVVIVLLAGNVALFAALLHSFEFSRAVSFSLGIAAFTLPGAQNSIFMTSLPNPLTSLLALGAYAVWSRPTAETRHPITGSGASCIVSAMSAFIILLTSMFGYVALSFFFLVPALVPVLFKKETVRAIFLRVFRDVVFFAVALVCFYAGTKLVFARIYAVDTSPAYQFAVHPQVFFAKLGMFATTIMPTVFNLWNVYTVPAIGLILTGFFLGMLVRTRKREAAPLAGLAAGIFLLANCFVLLNPTHLVLFRFLLVSGVLALLCLYGALSAFEGSGRRAVAAAVALAVIGWGTACFTVTQNVFNSNMEFEFIRDRLAAHQGPLRRIHVVLPQPSGRGYNGLPSVGDDFNRKTLDYSADTEDMIRIALLYNPHIKLDRIFQCNVHQVFCAKMTPPGEILVTKGLPEVAVIPTPQMLVIDMNELVKKAQMKTYK